MSVSNRISKFCLAVIALLLCYGIGWHYGSKHHFEDDNEMVDTLIIERWDTFYVDRPKEIIRYVIRYDTIRDTSITFITDSISGDSTAIIPIEQAIYQDSTENAKYVAYLSGYRPELDSISINCKQTTEYITEYVREKQRRIGIGAQIGIGYAGKLTPYIGVGLQYRLW